MSKQLLEYGRARRPVVVRFIISRLRGLLPYLLLLVLCYVGSYACMSRYGTYEPLIIGIGHVKSYAWSPAGFVKDWKHRWWLYEFYLPLYVADRQHWHRDQDCYSGKYPVHEPNDVNEVYAAWRTR
jgi:hypothetical protein